MTTTSVPTPNVMQPDDIRARWTRSAALIAAFVSCLYVLAVLGFGYVFIRGWSTLACWDGTEPACRKPASDRGLSAVRTSSWLLGAAAVVAAVGALALALRVRRAAGLAAVLLLCTTSAVVAYALWSRLY